MRIADNASTECAAPLTVAALAIHHMHYQLNMHSTRLLPLYGGWRLGRHIVAHAVDAAALVDDSVSDLP